MRNSTYHGPKSRPAQPVRHRCQKCGENAPFTVAENVHLCGKHFDEYDAREGRLLECEQCGARATYSDGEDICESCGWCGTLNEVAA